MSHFIVIHRISLEFRVYDQSGLIPIYENQQKQGVLIREVKTGEETPAGAVCDVICELVSVDVATEQR